MDNKIGLTTRGTGTYLKFDCVAFLEMMIWPRRLLENMHWKKP